MPATTGFITLTAAMKVLVLFAGNLSHLILYLRAVLPEYASGFPSLSIATIAYWLARLGPCPWAVRTGSRSNHTLDQNFHFGLRVADS